MTCIHLQKLYRLCADNKIKLSGTDLVQIVCEECGVQEECPSMLMEEYEYKESLKGSDKGQPDAQQDAPSDPTDA